MDIRPATPADLPEIQAIHAHHVLHGTGSLEEVPPSVEEIAARFARDTGQGWSWLVATDATGVLGYAYYVQYGSLPAYRFTAEDRVYVREDVRGQGVGKALVGRLIAHATERGFRQMVAVIGGAENVGSIGVHASLGFTHAGVLRAAGLKFGRWLDVVVMQRPLGAGDADVPGK